MHVTSFKNTIHDNEIIEKCYLQFFASKTFVFKTLQNYNHIKIDTDEYTSIYIYIYNSFAHCFSVSFAIDFKLI